MYTLCMETALCLSPVLISNIGDVNLKVSSSKSHFVVFYKNFEIKVRLSSFKALRRKLRNYRQSFTIYSNTFWVLLIILRFSQTVRNFRFQVKKLKINARSSTSLRWSMKVDCPTKNHHILKCGLKSEIKEIMYPFSRYPNNLIDFPERCPICRMKNYTTLPLCDGKTKTTFTFIKTNPVDPYLNLPPSNWDWNFSSALRVYVYFAWKPSSDLKSDFLTNRK